MNIVFAGTPEFAAVALEALLRAGHAVPLTLTQPDRPAGRGLKAQPSAVKSLAVKRGLPVLQPTTLKDRSVIDVIAALKPDALVVAAYGLIVPQALLDVPRLGGINIHASLLPRWRGAAPIQRAILAGDAQTGITIMQMDAGLDTGAILLQDAVPISGDDTAVAARPACSARRTACRASAERPARGARAGRHGRDVCRQDRQARSAH